MSYYFPYMLVFVFAGISASKGGDIKSRLFWTEIGASFAIMLVFRDVYFAVAG